MKTEGFLYICSMRVIVYDKYESYYQSQADIHNFKVTGKSSLWESRDVTEEELLALARNGEKILVNP